MTTGQTRKEDSIVIKGRGGNHYKHTQRNNELIAIQLIQGKEVYEYYGIK